MGEKLHRAAEARAQEVQRELENELQVAHDEIADKNAEFDGMKAEFDGMKACARPPKQEEPLSTIACHSRRHAAVTSCAVCGTHAAPLAFFACLLPRWTSVPKSTCSKRSERS